MFSPGDFVVCVSSVPAGKKYIGAEGTVVADDGKAVSVLPTDESRRRSDFPEGTGNWVFYRTSYELELVNSGNICEDWS